MNASTQQRIYYKLDFSKLAPVNTDEFFEKEISDILTDSDKQLIIAHMIVDGCEHVCANIDGIRRINSESIQSICDVANRDCGKFGEEIKNAGINTFLSLLTVIK